MQASLSQLILSTELERSVERLTNPGWRRQGVAGAERFQGVSQDVIAECLREEPEGRN